MQLMRFRVGNERSQMRFSDVNLLELPNAFDLLFNVWPPECVVQDTDPPQLLRSNCYLPMDSLVGMSVEEVNIYTWQDPPQYPSAICIKCFLWSLCVLEPQSFISLGLLVSENTFLMHNIFPCQWTLYECTMCDLSTNIHKTRSKKHEH